MPIHLHKSWLETRKEAKEGNVSFVESSLFRQKSKKYLRLILMNDMRLQMWSEHLKHVFQVTTKREGKEDKSRGKLEIVVKYAFMYTASKKS